MIIGLLIILVVAAIIGGVALFDAALHWMIWIALAVFIIGVAYGLIATYLPTTFRWGAKVGRSKLDVPGDLPRADDSDPL